MSVDGKWRIVVDSPVGRQEAVFEFAADGNQLTGKCYNGTTVVDIQNGEVNGNQIKFITKIRQPLPMKLTYTLVVSGDAISGEVKPGMFGKQPVKGQRI